MILTFTGKVVDPFNVQEADICLEDAAHALSLICRYSGNGAFHYSVAQHSVLLSRAVPEHLRKAALLHDWGEVFIGDIISPVKRCLPDLGEIRILETVFNKYGVDINDLEELDEYDYRIGRNETDTLYAHLGGIPEFCGVRSVPPLINVNIEKITPDVAKAMFKDEFAKLFREGIYEREDGTENQLSLV